eukprot:gene12369-10640_t
MAVTYQLTKSLYPEYSNLRATSLLILTAGCATASAQTPETPETCADGAARLGVQACSDGYAEWATNPTTQRASRGLLALTTLPGGTPHVNAPTTVPRS